MVVEVTSTQGFVLTFSSPRACQRISLYLDSITDKQVIEAFDWPNIVASNAYKSFDAECVKTAKNGLEWVLKDFHRMKQFYSDVAAKGHAVLVVTD